jgi:hypothetical protein
MPYTAATIPPALEAVLPVRVVVTSPTSPHIQVDDPAHILQQREVRTKCGVVRETRRPMQHDQRRLLCRLASLVVEMPTADLEEQPYTIHFNPHENPRGHPLDIDTQNPLRFGG